MLSAKENSKVILIVALCECEILLRKYVIFTKMKIFRSLRKQSSSLQKNIFTIFNHVFGDNSCCATLPIECKPKEGEVNLIPQLQRTGAYNSVFEAVRYLSCHAASLLENVTNNVAESAKTVVNKLNSGKRINHCAKNSFEMRVHGGTIQHSSQELVSRVHLSTGMEVPASVSKMEKRRRLQISINRQVQVVRKPQIWHGTDKDYGPSAKKPDMAEDAYEVCV